LDCSRCHLELFCQLVPEREFRLRLNLERLFEGAKLRPRRSLPVLDLIRHVWVEGTKVDVGRVRVGWEDASVDV
jgi:hypothetical protein